MIGKITFCGDEEVAGAPTKKKKPATEKPATEKPATEKSATAAKRPAETGSKRPANTEDKAAKKPKEGPSAI
jgi:hypothetical protein